MKTEENVILGGGVIGLLIGNLLLDKGLDSVIYEEDAEIGEPQHCTGLISLSTLRLYPVAREKIITNKIYGVKIRIGDTLEKEFRSTTAKAIVVDRKLLEMKLAERYQNKGGNIILRKKADAEILRREKKLLINAGGAKELLKSGYKDVLPALQYDVYLNEDVDKRITTINIDKLLNPDYFSWITPINNRGFVRIGTASNNNLENKLRILIRNIFSKRNVEIKRKLGGQIITGGPRKKFVEGDVVYVGDSAGMVKISTGGGLNYGGIGGHMLAKVIYEKEYNEYRNLWINKFGKELLMQKLIRNVFLKLDNKELVELYGILSKREVFEQLFLIGNMDFHASSLYKILFEKDVTKILLKEKIVSNFIKYLFTKI